MQHDCLIPSLGDRCPRWNNN